MQEIQIPQVPFLSPFSFETTRGQLLMVVPFQIIDQAYCQIRNKMEQYGMVAEIVHFIFLSLCWEALFLQGFRM
jgi:hypothetical protein